MLMVPMPPALMDFNNADDFNRADSSTLGSGWRADFGNLKVATNRAQCATPASNTGRQGVWNTFVQSAQYNGGRLLTDNWAIEVPLIAPVGSQATDNATTIGGAMLDGGPAAGMVLVYYTVMTGGNGVTITTYSSSSIASPGAATGQANQTNRGSTAGTVALPMTARFERRMYSATQSIFTGYLSGISVVTWNDSTGIVPAGDITKRRWFLQAESNSPFFGGPYYSPAIDSVRAYDLKA